MNAKGLAFLMSLLLWNCAETKEEKLLIATAANMQFAMEEVIEAFTEKHGIACEMVIGSSGKLMAQIKEGAPYDVFVSADVKYIKELKADDLTDGGTIYAYGKLVLWNAQNKEIIRLEDLTNPDIKHIALANPKTAPYGEAAMQVLEKNNLLDAVQEKLVYGESIAQTNQFILSGAAEVGFTAMSVVKSPNMQERGTWVALEEADYEAIEQAVAVIKRSNEAELFAAFLMSSQSILERFGYSVEGILNEKIPFVNF